MSGLVMRAAMPVLRLFSPETEHGIAIRALKFGLAGHSAGDSPPELATRVWTLEFKNPVGLAGGFD